MSLADVEKQVIEAAFVEYKGNINHMARDLQITTPTITKKIRGYFDCTPSELREEYGFESPSNKRTSVYNAYRPISVYTAQLAPRADLRASEVK